MQEFLNWTIDTIREDKLIGSWLEERKYDWTPLISKAVVNLLDKNNSVLIVTDYQREWFLNYIISNINLPSNQRPLLPFYNFKSFVSESCNMQNENDIELIKDMLDISFPDGYTFWYIGRSQSVKANIAKISKNSLLWIFDEDISNSFSLRSDDDALDMKLLQMFRLYNKTLSATLFAQIDVEK
ncbi:DNA replication regulator family [hydrothermal vent metagenome]|uniref:DNA replication regulator family n=1 Tax=hydrothermal vent metagenome TaxID=652676 RepID=A0A3B1E4E3_9ZZZZ